MTRLKISDSASTFTRISKAGARKLWAQGEPFYIIAHKMRPGFPFSLGMMIDPEHIKQERNLTPTYPTVESLFDATVTEFCFYNANCHETGTYAAFYTVRDKAVAA
ncbi:MAG TPA: hypothetical protein VKQ11_00570 [Candidatus Sulfotelmatobacter sp.]|nr:hypothetical protein [Candidatus Sulfotelmatobacter sp.]